MAKRIPRDAVEAELIETLAARVAKKIFYQVGDRTRQVELQELLIEFAEEIKRQAIEPGG